MEYFAKKIFLVAMQRCDAILHYGSVPVTVPVERQKVIFSSISSAFTLEKTKSYRLFFDSHREIVLVVADFFVTPSTCGVDELFGVFADLWNPIRCFNSLSDNAECLTPADFDLHISTLGLRISPSLRISTLDHSIGVHRVERSLFEYTQNTQDFAIKNVILVLEDEPRKPYRYGFIPSYVTPTRHNAALRTIGREYDGLKRVVGFDMFHDEECGNVLIVLYRTPRISSMTPLAWADQVRSLYNLALCKIWSTPAGSPIFTSSFIECSSTKFKTELEICNINLEPTFRIEVIPGIACLSRSPFEYDPRDD